MANRLTALLTRSLRSRLLDRRRCRRNAPVLTGPGGRIDHIRGRQLPHLVIGAAGLISSSVARRLLARGDRIIGINNVSDYNSTTLKPDRLAHIGEEFGDALRIVKANVADDPAVRAAIRDHDVGAILHFAGSVVLPESVTTRSNIVATMPPRGAA